MSKNAYINSYFYILLTKMQFLKKFPAKIRTFQNPHRKLRKKHHSN